MTPDQIRAEIRRVLAEHGKLSVDLESVSDDADLFAVGMTSFASVNVMLALEEAFDVEFPDELLKRGVFESVNSIGAAVGSLLPSAA